MHLLLLFCFHILPALLPHSGGKLLSTVRANVRGHLPTPSIPFFFFCLPLSFPALRHHRQFPNQVLGFTPLGFCKCHYLLETPFLLISRLRSRFSYFRIWFYMGERHGRLGHFCGMFLHLLHSPMRIRRPF